MMKIAIRIPEAYKFYLKLYIYIYRYLKQVFENMKKSLDIEIQQRAVEFDSIFSKHNNLKYKQNNINIK